MPRNPSIIGVRILILRTSCPGCGRTTSTFFRELSEEIQDFLNYKRNCGIKTILALLA